MSSHLRIYLFVLLLALQHRQLVVDTASAVRTLFLVALTALLAGKFVAQLPSSFFASTVMATRTLVSPSTQLDQPRAQQFKLQPPPFRRREKRKGRVFQELCDVERPLSPKQILAHDTRIVFSPSFESSDSESDQTARHSPSHTPRTSTALSLESVCGSNVTVGTFGIPRRRSSHATAIPSPHSATDSPSHVVVRLSPTTSPVTPGRRTSCVLQSTTSSYDREPLSATLRRIGASRGASQKTESSFSYVPGWGVLGKAVCSKGGGVQSTVRAGARPSEAIARRSSSSTQRWSDGRLLGMNTLASYIFGNPQRARAMHTDVFLPTVEEQAPAPGVVLAMAQPSRADGWGGLRPRASWFPNLRLGPLLSPLTATEWEDVPDEGEGDTLTPTPNSPTKALRVRFPSFDVPVKQTPRLRRVLASMLIIAVAGAIACLVILLISGHAGHHVKNAKRAFPITFPTTRLRAHRRLLHTCTTTK